MFDSCYWRCSNTSTESSCSIAVVLNEQRKREWSWCVYYCRYTNTSKAERQSLTARVVFHRILIQEKTLKDWPLTSKSTSSSLSNCFIWKESATANTSVWSQTCQFLRCFYSLLTDQPLVTCDNQRQCFSLFSPICWLSLIDWEEKTRSDTYYDCQRRETAVFAQIRRQISRWRPVKVSNIYIQNTGRDATNHKQSLTMRFFISVFSLNIRNELDWASNVVFRSSLSRIWKAIK